MRPEDAPVAPFRDFGRKVYRAALARLSERNRINVSFLRYHLRLPDLENPKTFSEWMQWRKLNDLYSDERFSVYADKVRVKEIIARELGPEWVIPTLWHGKTLPDTLDWPTPYVVKANHAAGKNYFVRTPSDLDESVLRSLAESWLTSSHYAHLLETHYDRIDPQLLVEPVIGVNGVSPDDYKMFVFGGRVEFIQVDVDRFTDHRRATYDRNWNLLPLTYEYPAPIRMIDRPASLERMVEAAETLGKPFDFVRLDFYDPPEGPRFGEATFVPGSGYVSFRPRSMDRRLGDIWAPHIKARNPAPAHTPDASSPSAPVIALHIADLDGGGAERVCLTLAQHFLNRGYRVDMVLCKTKGPLVKDIPPGVRVVNLHASRSAVSLGPLVRYLRKETPAAMIANLVAQNTLGVLAANLAGVSTRVFVTQHAAVGRWVKREWSIWRRSAPLLYRWVLPKAAGAIAVSGGVAQDMERLSGFPASKIAVIYNPIDVEGVAAQAAAIVDDPFFATEEPVVMGAGRLMPAKDFRTLISGFALLARSRPVRLALCGTGQLEGELKAQIVSLGLQNRVKLLGFQANPFKYMAAADVFVLSSVAEGFGNVLVEAMACGTPVVSTDCPHGPVEILDHGRFGELTPMGDAEALAAAMGRALDNPLAKEVLIARAKDFSAERAVDKYLDTIGLPHTAPGFTRIEG